MSNSIQRTYSYRKHENDSRVFYEINSPFIIQNVVAIQYDCGSIDDPEDKQGLAHIVEHLFTHATIVETGNEYLTREYEGIQKQAFTYKEKTVYTILSATKRPNKLLSVFVKGLPKKLSEELLKTEKKTIETEILEREGSQSDAIYNHALLNASRLFNELKGHVHNITGNKDSISNINIDDTVNFVKNNYISPKIVIASSTPLTKKEIGNIFNTIKSVPGSHVSTEKSKIISQVKVKQKKHEQDTALRVFNFNIKDTNVIGFCIERPRTLEHDVYLGFIHEYFAGNWSSLLTQKLRVEKQLVYFANSAYFSYKKFALIYFFFDTKKNNASEATKIAIKALDDFLAGNINEKICTAVKNMRVNKLFDIYRYEQDLVHDFIDMLNFTGTENVIKLEDYIECTRKITPNKIRTYLNKVLPIK